MKLLTSVLTTIALLASCDSTSYPFTTVVDSVDVRYSLAVSGNVDVAVQNSYMTSVRTLVSSEEQDAGSHTVIWDLLDDDGEYPGDGLYTAEVFLDGERISVQILEVNKE